MSSSSGLDVLIETMVNATPRNPVEPYFASAWNYMTDNYSRFTIAMWISVVLHEVGRTMLSDSNHHVFAGSVFRTLSSWIHGPVPSVHEEIQNTTGS